MTPQRLAELLATYAAAQGCMLNADAAYVLDILEGLLANEKRYGYRSCPCRLASGNKEQDSDIICPCAYRAPDIEEYGSCFRGLYVSPEWNEGRIPHRPVPERRT